MRRPRAIAILPLLLASQLYAATPEAEVKATYLHKLAAFVRWPSAVPEGSPFTICVAGRSDIADALAAVARNQQVDGHRVAVVRLEAVQAQQARDCRMVYVGRGAETARAMVGATAGTPVLTVTDRSGGTRGGVIEFITTGGRVRLAVDRGEAAARNLELSSKLMEVAAEVRQ